MSNELERPWQTRENFVLDSENPSFSHSIGPAARSPFPSFSASVGSDKRKLCGGHESHFSPSTPTVSFQSISLLVKFQETESNSVNRNFFLFWFGLVFDF